MHLSGTLVRIMLSLQYRTSPRNGLPFSRRPSPRLCILHLIPECTCHSYSLDENVLESLTGKQAKFITEESEGNKDELQRAVSGVKSDHQQPDVPEKAS